jgi:hypothetical protein
LNESAISSSGQNENKNYKCSNEWLLQLQSLMRVWGTLGLVCFLLTKGNAQTQAGKVSLPPTPASEHRFWDRENVLLFSGVAVFRGLDYASTRNMLARGREEVLLPDDVVNNHAGFAGLEAASAATSVGISYLFHRTGHHKLERWLSIGHIGVTGFGVARNYSLKSRF